MLIVGSNVLLSFFKNFNSKRNSFPTLDITSFSSYTTSFTSSKEGRKWNSFTMACSPRFHIISNSLAFYHLVHIR